MIEETDQDILDAIELLKANNYSVIKRWDLIKKKEFNDKKKDTLEKLNSLADYHNFKSESRKANIVYKRHYFSYFCHKYFKLTLVEIGSLTNRTHATCINSIKKHKELKIYDDYKKLIIGLKSDLNNIKNN